MIYVYRQWILKKPRAQFQSRGLGAAQDVASPPIGVVSFQSLHIYEICTCGSGREVVEGQGKVEGTDELFTSRAQTLCTFPNTRSSAFQNLPLTLLATRIGTRIGCIVEGSQSHTTDPDHVGLRVSDRRILQNGNDFTKNQSKQQGEGDQH